MNSDSNDRIWLPKLPADPIIGPLPHTPEWYAFRKYDANRNPPVVLGASVAGAICGMSKFTMALDVYMRQLDLMEEQFVTKAMKAGIHYEQVACKQFAEEKNVKLVNASFGIKVPMYFSRQWPWLAATPDDIAVFVPDLEGIEAKVTSFRRYDEFGIDINSYGEDETDQLPQDNVMQAQAQMAVTGLKAVNFPVIFDVYTTRYYRVERNEELISIIIAAGEEMVERIINRDPPPANYHNPRAAKVLQQLHGLTIDKTIDMTDELYEIYTQFAHAKLKIKEFETIRDELRAAIQDQMQDAQIAVFPRGTKQIKRTYVNPEIWTVDHVREAEEKLGTVKKKGHERLTESKVK